MDTLLFIIAKLVGFLIRIDSWIVIAVVVVCLFLSMGMFKLAQRLSIGLLLALLALAILPLGDLALRPFESIYPVISAPERVDGVIVLGGSEDLAATSYWGQEQLNGAAERLTAAMVLARRFPQSNILLAGGSGRMRDVAGATHSEADLAKRVLVDQGIDPSRVTTETTSRNTAENANNTFKAARPKPTEVWLLVTSAFHMPRAMRTFTRAGWPVLVPYPVDFRTRAFVDALGWNLLRNIQILNTAISETVALMAVRIRG